MNDHLQQELAAWLSRLREATDAGASFALEQAPLLVQEKVLVDRVWLTGTVLVCIVASVVCWRVLAKYIRTVDPEDFTDTNPLVVIPLAFVILFCVVMAASTSKPLATVWFAPRLYVLEWLAGLLK